MPCVLWGVACLSLPRDTTVGEVVHEFREALSLNRREDVEENSPQVELYRLVPIEAGRVGGEDRIVAHLPNSTFGVTDIEDLRRQREDAEIRYDRVRESLLAMESDLESSTRHEATGRAPAQQMCHLLRTENKVLRYKLDQSEVMRQELQETADMLRREFMLLVHEVMPRASENSAPEGASALRRVMSDAKSPRGESCESQVLASLSHDHAAVRRYPLRSPRTERLETSPRIPGQWSMRSM